MKKVPTGLHLCQSIFYGLRENHDAPFCHWHGLPSKGCITGSQSLEGYVIGKAHWIVYSCSLCAHSRDDIITKCFSHQILAYHQPRLAHHRLNLSPDKCQASTLNMCSTCARSSAATWESTRWLLVFSVNLRHRYSLPRLWDREMLSRWTRRNNDVWVCVCSGVSVCKWLMVLRARGEKEEEATGQVSYSSMDLPAACVWGPTPTCKSHTFLKNNGRNSTGVQGGGSVPCAY